MPFVEGAHAVHGDLLELLLNRTWRPTVSYTGAEGFPTIEKGGTYDIISSRVHFYSH